MPAIKIPRSGYHFLFFSNENNEPAHVHVTRAGNEAKFWLGPVSLAGNDGFVAHELNKIKNLVIKHEDEIQAAWDKHFPHCRPQR